MSDIIGKRGRAGKLKQHYHSDGLCKRDFEGAHKEKAETYNKKKTKLRSRACYLMVLEFIFKRDTIRKRMNVYGRENQMNQI
jgi:hypothetical protein